MNEFAPAAVHPTQIYEALCYLITFGILCWLYYAKDIARRRPGILFGIGLVYALMGVFVGIGTVAPRLFGQRLLRKHFQKAGIVG